MNPKITREITKVLASSAMALAFTAGTLYLLREDPDKNGNRSTAAIAGLLGGVVGWDETKRLLRS
jgi:hypothetical protein